MANLDFREKEKGVFEFEWQGLSIEARSVAGVETFVSIPQLKICFDVGYSHPSLWNHKIYFISHCHMDHASGIPYLISTKALNQQATPIFYMPSSMIKNVTKVMDLWQEMEGHIYSFDFQASDSCRVELNANYFVKSFPTSHRVPSNGYCLFQRKKSLKKDYVNLTREQIIEKKQAGHILEEFVESPVLAVTCDTTLDFLKKESWVYEVPCLMIETTYADERKTRENAREWGHIHLDELIENLYLFKNQKIILKHFSRRHKYQEVLQILEKKLPEEWKARVEILPW